MKSDQALKQDVEQELLWDPAIDARQIRVTVHDRIVTLVGVVASYAQKLAAQKATQRVTGCRALVIELIVPESSPASHSDEDLATAILSSLKSAGRPPQGRHSGRSRTRLRDPWRRSRLGLSASCRRNAREPHAWSIGCVEPDHRPGRCSRCRRWHPDFCSTCATCTARVRRHRNRCARRGRHADRYCQFARRKARCVRGCVVSEGSTARRGKVERGVKRGPRAQSCTSLRLKCSNRHSTFGTASSAAQGLHFGATAAIRLPPELVDSERGLARNSNSPCRPTRPLDQERWQ